MTELIELIRTTEKVGTGEQHDPVHRHTQLWTTDGMLVVEMCDQTGCEALDPPEGWI